MSASAVAVVAVGVHLALAGSGSVPTALLLLTGPAGKPGAVLPVDLETGAAGHPIPVGVDPVAIALAPDGQTAYVSNSGSGDITPIDLADGQAEPPIPVAPSVGDLVVAPDGRTIYVLDPAARTLLPVDLRTGQIGRAVNLDVGEFGSAASPTTMSISPTGTLIVVSYQYQLIQVRIPAGVVTQVYGMGLPPEVGQVVIGPSGTVAYHDNVMAVGRTNLTGAPSPPGQPGAVGIFDPGELLIGPPHGTLYVQSGTNPTGIIPVDVATMTKETLLPLAVNGMALAPGSSTLWAETATGLVPIDLLTRAIGKPWPLRPPPTYSIAGFVVTASGIFG